MLKYRKHKLKAGVRAPVVRTRTKRARQPDIAYHSFLTTMSPIESVSDNESLDKIEAFLHSRSGVESPLCQCPMVHMFRLQVITQLRPALGDRTSESLKSKYLLMMVDVDGDVADFLDCLYGADAEYVENLWGACIGYPNEKGAVFFRRYIERCALPVQLPFAAFPAGVLQTLEALDTQRALAHWMDVHHMTGDGLKQQWVQFTRVLDARGQMKPGGPRPPGRILVDFEEKPDEVDRFSATEEAV